MLTNSHFSEDFRGKKQFIDRLNKLDVFELYVDDILVQLVTDAHALHCVNSSCKRQSYLPTRATSIRNQSLIAVAELCLYAIYDTRCVLGLRKRSVVGVLAPKIFHHFHTLFLELKGGRSSAIFSIGKLHSCATAS